MLVDGESPTYTCICLNIRIRSFQSHSNNPPLPATDPHFTSVHVGDDGITIIHPQVTLRTRSRGVITGTSQYTRYTSLTCLVCQTLAYRVHQVVSPNVDGKDGPLLPTDDWVEHEVMKSSTGWIEVHESCLTGDSITRTAGSPSYSDTFGVLLHPDTLPQSAPPFMTPDPSPAFPSSSPPFRPPSPPDAPQSFLSTMKPLFPPPPFTSSHPTFVHFSTLASDESQRLRASAEADISQAVADRVALVQQAEDKLKRQVETLWTRFRQGIAKVEHDGVQSTKRSSLVRPKDGDNWTAANNEATQANPVSIRDFTPLPITPTRTVTSPPRISSLSASLARSSFHHPKESSADSGENIPHSPYSPTSSHNSSASRASSESSGFAARRPSGERGNILEPFRRSMDQAKDAAASFTLQAGKAALTTQVGRGRSADVKDGDGDKKNQTKDSQSDHELSSQRSAHEGNGASEKPRPREDDCKGKRKVTFDVTPDIVNNEGDVRKEGTPAAVEEEGELIFNLEDEGSDRSSLDSIAKPLPPTAEPKSSRPRRIRTSKASMPGLPESFRVLRPTSLPFPSHVNPPKGRSSVDPSRRAPLLPARNTQRKPRTTPPVEEDINSLEGLDVEILKLVAASTPSHRGAWKKDSKAWQLFVRRKDGRPDYSGIIPEEIEDGDGVGFHRGALQDNQEEGASDSNGFHDLETTLRPTVGSLPIAMNASSIPREGPSLGSYPQHTVADSFPSAAYGRSFPSSTALRKAVYAERDRTRSIDPGALDFAAEDEDEESDDDVSKSETAYAGEKGRKRALKILQAFSELPEPGMWRSLA